jgi:hypothetical protein
MGWDGRDRADDRAQPRQHTVIGRDRTLIRISAPLLLLMILLFQQFELVLFLCKSIAS